jgi:nitroreductase
MIVFHANRDAENNEADGYIALSHGFLAAHALGLGARPSILFVTLSSTVPR